MKRLINRHFIFLIFSLIVPSLYLLMYLPVWDGKNLPLHNDGLIIVVFAFQCICFVVALLRLVLYLAHHKENSLAWLVFDFAVVLSFVILCFVAYFFTLNLYDLPIFPPQD